MTSRSIRMAAPVMTAALLLIAPALRAQEPVGRLFDQAYPAVVQILVAVPDSIRQGSGFVVDGDGLVLTHLPLLEDARTIFVRPSTDDSYYRARVLAADERRGIGALRVETSSLPSLRIAPAASLREGARVTAVGLALESENPVAQAVVRGRRDPTSYVLKPTSPLAPGLTGGPVLSEQGEVVAMVVVVDGQRDALAVPIASADELLAEIGLDDAREGGIAGTQTAARARSEADARPPAPPPSPSAQPPSPPAAVSERPADVSGRWLVTNTIQRSSHPPFEGLQLGFELTLRQEGDRVVGEGRKVSENGRQLPQAARSPLRLEGTLEGNTLNATFRERGARRTIHGLFSWFFDEQGDELGGRFADTGNRTRGISRGTKLE